jgi:hypothetical protein
MKIIPPASSDETKEGIMVMKNNTDPNTDNLEAQCFKCGGNDLYNKMTEILTKLQEGEERP